jgi:UDP-glucose 4-epimerase
MKVLITGISGILGRLVAEQLVAGGHTVIGIDFRPWSNPPNGVRVFQTDIRKRPAEDLFRTEHPDAVVHMATVSHLNYGSQERYRINLGGTQAIFEHAHTYGVKQAVFVGRHTYYGAASDAPLYHTEDDPPLAVQTFPELSDLVAADLYAGSVLWRHPELNTAVLRLCYTLGPGNHGTLAAYLKGPRVPSVLGYDPLFQFLHIHDAARAICMALTSRIRGVYNVAGPSPVPLSLLISETGRSNLPVPEPLFPLVLGRFGLPRLPRGAVEHIKYSVVIDASTFRAATGFDAEFDEAEVMHAFRASHRIG